MKLFQRHIATKLSDGRTFRNYSYVLANNNEDACFSSCISKIDVNREIYAIQVSKNTLEDEIKHCEEHIKILESNNTNYYSNSIMNEKKHNLQEYKTILAKVI